MKTLPKITAGVLIAAIQLTACTKTDVDSDTTNGMSPSSYFAQNQTSAKQMFSINPAQYNQITGNQGTEVVIYAGSFVDAQSNPITGNVDFELIEIFSRGDMFKMNRATMANHWSGDKRLLVSGGEYYINATQNGQQVFLAQDVRVRVPYANGGGFNEQMRNFEGQVQPDGDIVWNMAGDSVIPVDSLNNDSIFLGAGYDILEGEWGWTNVDRWYNDPREKTTIYIDAPEGLNLSNCEVFLTYDGEPLALAQLDTWESDMFSEHYGLIPIGLECHVILVTEIDGVLNYAIQGFTVTENHIEVISSLQPTTQSELADLINALP